MLLLHYFSATLDYLGHSEEGTGNWCFKDGTISFQEIFDLYTKHHSGKPFIIQSDCCYSGHWVRDCAKTLDQLGIPPCGHRAGERGVLIKVLTSCQPDQKAAEPCYSMEAVTVNVDGTTTTYAKQLTQQRSTWFDGTRLVCCRGPDSPCPENTFKHLKWEDGVGRRLPYRWVKRKEGEAYKWYYIMLNRASKEYGSTFSSQFAKDPDMHLSDWGHVLESGKGRDIPRRILHKVNNWTSVANLK